MKLQLMNNKQFFITLPNAIVRAKGWKKGEDIKALIDQRGNIVLKKGENPKQDLEFNSVRVKKKTWNRLDSLKNKLKKDNPDYFKEKELDKFKE